MSITFSKFGHHGRLGNQLFQLAALIGLAKKYGHQLALPDWKYSKYFEFHYPKGNLPKAIRINEQHFHYDEQQFSALENREGNFDLLGWLQSEKYFEDAAVHNRLMFKTDFIAEVLKKFPALEGSGHIAISIRRGDYVGNPNYYQLPITYYLHALFEHFPGWRNQKVIIFSDDIPYCKIHFAAAPNVQYAEDLSDIEQLCAMSMCKHFIISNSTFAWWGAWLGEKYQSIVVRPAHHFAGKLAETCNPKDYYPSRWKEFNHEGRKFNLSNVTFTIPVSYDHPHRRQNLDLTVCLLQQAFDTNIIIGEQGAKPVFHYFSKWCQYTWFPYKDFHRTRMLNQMAHMATTEHVVNWDADVMLPPLSIIEAASALNNGVPFVHPYDGRFARVHRAWQPQLEKMLDVGIFGNSQFPGMAPEDPRSVGGAIFCNKKAFMAAGMENEHMVSYAPEDRERIYRFMAFGYIVARVHGPIYHLDHWRGPDSSSKNPHFAENTALYKKYLTMPSDEIRREVKTWPWIQPPTGNRQAENGNMDVVIPLGNGSPWKNNELRYFLRSLHRHLQGYGTIYIIGSCPDWLNTQAPGIQHIPIANVHPAEPARNIYQKLLMACFLPGMSEKFLYCNDGYVFTQDVVAQNIIAHYKEHNLEESANRVQAGNTFRQALLNTAKALRDAKCDIKNFDVHVPMHINKNDFVQLQDYNWNLPYGFTAKSLYANTFSIEGEAWYDCKINKDETPEHLNQLATQRWVFSYGDGAIFGNLRQWLQDRFPDKSPWEK